VSLPNFQNKKEEEMEKLSTSIQKVPLDHREFNRLPKDLDWMDKKLFKISSTPEGIQLST